MGKVATVLVPVLGLSLVGAGYWGYQEHQEKNSILIKAENQYQQAFHNLSFYMNELHDELGKSIALNSRKQLGPCLTNIWRIAYAAQNSVGQLPLTLMPFNKTEEFLARIGSFSYKTAVRDLDKDPLTNNEWQTLKQLYSSSKEIRNDLQKVQTQVFEKNLRWMDVETALATEDKKLDNTIIDGFKLIDKRVEGYSEIDFGTTALTNEEKRIKKLKQLQGKEISKEEAKAKALQFAGIKDNREVKVSETGKDAFISAYDVVMQDPKKGSNTMVEVTKKGGHIVWMLDTREIGEANLTVAQAETRARRYLKQRNYDPMETAKIEAYDHMGVFTFVGSENGIRIYPDAIVVKVALDNGQVVGFHAEDHIANHKSRQISEPTLSMEEAKSRVNQNMKIEETHLAIIDNDLDQEVLCYEIVGTIGDDHYHIFINAENGEEEKVEKLNLDQENRV